MCHREPNLFKRIVCRSAPQTAMRSWLVPPVQTCSASAAKARHSANGVCLPTLGIIKSCSAAEVLIDGETLSYAMGAREPSETMTDCVHCSMSRLLLSVVWSDNSFEGVIKEKVLQGSGALVLSAALHCLCKPVRAKC